MGLSKIAHFTENISPAGLAGAKLWPWYESKYFNSATPLIDLGAEWDLVGPAEAGGGNSFMYVKCAAGVSLTAGQLVSFATPTASTVTASGSSTQMIVWAAGSLTANAEVGNYLYIANSTSSGGGFTLRRIISNTTTTITFSTTDYSVASKPADANALELAATNGDVAIIIRPYQVIVNTATTVPCGVALGTVTAAYYTIVQTKGLALLSTIGNGTATAVGVPGVGTSAGSIIGGGGTASAYTGTNMVAMSAYSAAGPGLTPFLINLKGQF
jgi:hypothetical protein